MIADPETIKRIREQAKSRAGDELANMPFSVLVNAVASKSVYEAIERAYLAGADAGYTAAIAEERKP